MTVNKPKFEYKDFILEETHNGITELTRQLQTYLNYRKALVCSVCSMESQISRGIFTPFFEKWEKKLLSTIPLFLDLLRKIGSSDENLKEKIFHLRIAIISNPRSSNLLLLKQLIEIKNKLWKILHILSNCDTQEKPNLLKLAIENLELMCIAESELRPSFSDFFIQLKKNYQQLVQEYEYFFLGIKNSENVTKKKNQRERDYQ